MPDIAVFTKCVMFYRFRERRLCFGWISSLSTDFNSSGKHSNALTDVVVVFLMRTASTNTVFGPGIPVDYILRKRQNLALPVRNYISSILITSFTLRWFPAQDLSVRITKIKIIAELITKHMRWVLHLNLVTDKFKCYSAFCDFMLLHMVVN